MLIKNLVVVIGEDLMMVLQKVHHKSKRNSKDFNGEIINII